ncbi:MAG TPA: acyltransferase, partial [Candidatus Thermoplasmatota archaeon]|nr:acyltransferase [Candidatus Thermoplasmatota archaeon]
MARAEVPQLTILRGAAALAIVVFHAFAQYKGLRGWPDGGAPPFLNHFWIAVDLFFVLSGFLIAGPWLNHPALVRKAWRWGIYLRRRAVRIVPPYYAAVAVAVAVLAMSARGLLPPYPDLPPAAGWRDVWSHLLFLHPLHPDTFFSLNPVFWTLGVEAQFYLALPLLAAATSLWPRATVAAAAATTLAVRYATYSPDLALGLIGFQLPGFTFHFVLGILAARLMGRQAKVPRWLERTWWLPATLLVALPLLLLPPGATAQATESRLAHVLVRPLVAMGFALAVFFLARRPVPDRAGPGLAGGVWLGRISYSLYLIHIPVLMVAHGLVGLPFWAYLLVGTGLCLAASALFFWAVERPCLRLLATGWPRDPENPRPVPTS